MKFGFAWSWGFEKKSFENIGHIHVYNPGAGADNPLGKLFLINTFIQSI